MEPESKKKKMVHVRLSEEEHKRIRVLVAEKGTTMQEWLYDIIVDKIKEEERDTHE